METDKYHKIIDSYLEKFSDAEKLSQFAQVCRIAHKALMEVDILNELLENERPENKA